MKKLVVVLSAILAVFFSVNVSANEDTSYLTPENVALYLAYEMDGVFGCYSSPADRVVKAQDGGCFHISRSYTPYETKSALDREISFYSDIRWIGGWDVVDSDHSIVLSRIFEFPSADITMAFMLRGPDIIILDVSFLR